jgi:hypothetical protein
MLAIVIPVVSVVVIFLAKECLGIDQHLHEL